MRSTFPVYILALTLCLPLGNVWCAEAIEDVAGNDVTAPGPKTSNMESWQEDERKDSWTWFGMGYESRRASSTPQGSPAAGTGGKGGPSGHGGPGNGMKR